MILDYNPHTKMFLLRVPRGQHDIRELVKQHGLDLSVPASTAAEAVLFTQEPFAAVTFMEHATPAAREQLGALAAEIDKSWAAESAGHFRCPADKELWPFQKADLEYALAREHCLIGDEPGLGKTPTAICYCNERAAKRVLVLCPANIRLQWQKRIYEWSTMQWGYHVHVILDSRHGVHPTAEWTVVSYDLARTPLIGAQLAQLDYDVLILDEAHYLKTIDSKRTRSVFGGGENRKFEPLMHKAKHVLALTGTPLPNRPREAYTLARGLCWDSIDYVSEDRFRHRFNPSEKKEIIDPNTGRKKVYIDERSGRHAELQARLRSGFMVRHLKRAVMPQLKLPIYDLILVEETKAVKQALEAESLLDIDPGEPGRRGHDNPGPHSRRAQADGRGGGAAGCRVCRNAARRRRGQAGAVRLAHRSSVDLDAGATPLQPGADRRRGSACQKAGACKRVHRQPGLPPYHRQHAEHGRRGGWPARCLRARAAG